MSQPDPLPPLKPYNPKVSMDPRVYYKTQSSTYDRLILGKQLTDKDIDRYAELRKGNQVPGQKGKSASAGNRAARRRPKQILHDLKAALGLP